MKRRVQVRMAWARGTWSTPSVDVELDQNERIVNAYFVADTALGHAASMAPGAGWWHIAVERTVSS